MRTKITFKKSDDSQSAKVDPTTHIANKAPVQQPPRLFHLLGKAQHNLFRSADAIFTSELGYSGTQIAALFTLKGKEGCQLNELGRLLNLKNSAITGLIARMEENGLIARGQSAVDARAGALHLSERGREVLAEALPVLNSLNKQLKRGYTEQELSVVARFLNHASHLQFEKGMSS